MTQGYQVKGQKMPKRLDDEQIASIARHLLWAHSFRDLAEEGINTAPMSLDVNIFRQTDGRLEAAESRISQVCCRNAHQNQCGD